MAQKAYDLCLYGVPRVNRLPKDFPPSPFRLRAPRYGGQVGLRRAGKFTLGDRIADAALGAIEALVDARHTRERRDILMRANLRLERMRVFPRMAQDFGILPLKSLEHSSKLIGEVGARVGGWLKKACPERA